LTILIIPMAIIVQIIKIKKFLSKFLEFDSIKINVIGHFIKE